MRAVGHAHASRSLFWRDALRLGILLKDMFATEGTFDDEKLRHAYFSVLARAALDPAAPPVRQATALIAGMGCVPDAAAVRAGRTDHPSQEAHTGLVRTLDELHGMLARSYLVGSALEAAAMQIVEKLTYGALRTRSVRGHPTHARSTRRMGSPGVAGTRCWAWRCLCGCARSSAAASSTLTTSRRRPPRPCTLRCWTRWVPLPARNADALHARYRMLTGPPAVAASGADPSWPLGSRSCA